MDFYRQTRMELLIRAMSTKVSNLRLLDNFMAKSRDREVA